MFLNENISIKLVFLFLFSEAKRTWQNVFSGF